jgi:hypothetical protein
MENVRLAKALTAADRSADMLAAELASARVEIAGLLRSKEVNLGLMSAIHREYEQLYAAKLCPGCGQAADDDGPDTDVWATDPTRQEP